MKKNMIKTVLSLGFTGLLASSVVLANTTFVEEHHQANVIADGQLIAGWLGDRLDDTGETIEIKSRIYKDDVMDNTDVEVEIRDNHVVLTGVVNTQAQKQRAEDIARSEEGIVSVENRITVTGMKNQAHENILEHGINAIDDSTVSIQVRANLRAAGLHSGTDIDVKTLNDAVVLEGYVVNWDQYHDAEKITRGTAGVDKVINKLSVRSSTGL